jgi:hypothetical protein
MVFAMQVDGIKLQYKIQFAQSKRKKNCVTYIFPTFSPVDNMSIPYIIRNFLFFHSSFFSFHESGEFLFLKKFFSKIFSQNNENSQTPILIVEKQFSLLLLVHITLYPFLGPKNQNTLLKVTITKAMAHKNIYTFNTYKVVL